MATYKVYLTGNFCREIDVEIEPDEDGFLDDYEIEVKAIQEFESEYSVSTPGWSECWDNVTIDGVEQIGE
jgi:uncharacterized membrane protein